VHAAVTPEAAVFTLRDEGPGFDPHTIPDPTDPANLLQTSGRGVFLMRAFMDDVRFSAAGNEVTLTKRLSGRASGNG
jgi:anti-sigma regulatory factor (Ser/Thr protein kinase)